MPSDKYIKHAKLRTDLRNDTNKAHNEYLYYCKREATYYLVNLVTTWIRLKKSIGMKEVDNYIWRLLNGYKQEEKPKTAEDSRTHNLQ
jgi:hypothetical protein